ncbi:hypothetical protein FGG08_001631 [Glutinoglossum americanum]|uniref:BAH domain-containing protein n=1 Tax=Glutinoglossum americanum TaxID=1670608 RepID=A0A9P8L2J6_9PEZI|nr:hypothetical protein FGG08_001631 [Glutinoglossum americanum]
MGPKRKRERDDGDVEPDENDNEQNGTPEGSSLSSSKVVHAIVPFSIEYLHPGQKGKPKKKKATKKRNSNGPATPTTPTATLNPFSKEGFDVPIVVKPVARWEGLKPYKNFMIGEESFGVNQHVYVNHSDAPQGTDLSDMDMHDFWVAKVLEIRALDAQHVYVRVVWYYWPDELPNGRSYYHGKNELVASNHMEVIDAMTVTGRAHVQHWQENDEEEEVSGFFWRQKYHMLLRQLSKVREHCICKRSHNPDNLMIGCNNPDCKKWLHEECIIEDVLRKTYRRLVLKEPVTEATSPPNVKGSSGANGTKEPWEGMFQAKIKNKDKIATAVITDLREDGGENKEESKGEDTSGDDEEGKEKHPKTWKEDIVCLVCHEKVQ